MKEITLTLYQILNYTHRKKVDFIYIDPPYNTGGDWKYNNRIVKSDDPYRHSLWLQFMKNRLIIAKNLLKDNGVICVTIDNNEAPRLWLLLEKIFSSKNFLGEVVIRNNPASRNVDGKIALQHEYAFFFGKSHKTDPKDKKIVSKLNAFRIDPRDKTHKYIKDENGNWYSPTNLRKTGVGNDGIKKDGSLHHMTLSNLCRSERWFNFYINKTTY